MVGERYLSLADATAIAFGSPFMITARAAALLALRFGESPGPSFWLGAAVIVVAGVHAVRGR